MHSDAHTSLPGPGPAHPLAYTSVSSTSSQPPSFALNPHPDDSLTDSGLGFFNINLSAGPAAQTQLNQCGEPSRFFQARVGYCGHLGQKYLKNYRTGSKQR